MWLLRRTTLEMPLGGHNRLPLDAEELLLPLLGAGRAVCEKGLLPCHAAQELLLRVLMRQYFLFEYLLSVYPPTSAGRR